MCSQAIKGGHWVLLDELNLADQSVLEGLNAVLDHRQEVFIPELGETVRCPPSFRLFAAQNPLQEGGGRKGLPKSLLNRFSRVLVDLLQSSDLLHIAHARHARIPEITLRPMVKFVCALHSSVNLARRFGQEGAPWEFNLRDLLRWCDLVEGAVPAKSTISRVDISGADISGVGGVGSGAVCGLDGEDVRAYADAAAHFARMLFEHRMRSASDRAHVRTLYADAWNSATPAHPAPAKVNVTLSAPTLVVGRVSLPRHGPPATAIPASGSAAAVSDLSRASRAGHAKLQSDLLSASVPALEWLATCCRRAWMAILVTPDVAAAAATIRLLAAATATPLVEIPLTPASDTSELLGGFEQLDPVRALLASAQTLLIVARSLSRALLSAPAPALADRLAAASALAHAAPVVERLTTADPPPASAAIVFALRNLVQHLEAACALLRRGGVCPEGLEARVGACSDGVTAAALAAVAAETSTVGGRFQWVDGLLLAAIEHGHWVLMLQPNLCSAAVLDRLNSLLEPQGTLYVNECGSTDAGPRIITPHPDFRLFLAMDPALGELSRAMRNRGIEIHVGAPGFAAARAAATEPCGPLSCAEVRSPP